MIALPLFGKPDILTPKTIRFFGECGGSLTLILACSVMEFAIQELESDFSQWSEKYQVNLTRMVSAFPEMLGKSYNEFKVMCVVKGEMKDDCVLVFAIPGKVISYNLKDGNLDVLRDLEAGDLRFSDDTVNGRAYRFLETLSPV